MAISRIGRTWRSAGTRLHLKQISLPNISDATDKSGCDAHAQFYSPSAALSCGRSSFSARTRSFRAAIWPLLMWSAALWRWTPVALESELRGGAHGGATGEPASRLFVADSSRRARPPAIRRRRLPRNLNVRPPRSPSWREMSLNAETRKVADGMQRAPSDLKSINPASAFPAA